MKQRKLIGTCLIFSLISLTFTIVLSDAIMPNESFAKSKNVQYEQKIQSNQTYGGPGFDYAFTFIQTTDGGYALAGVTDSYGAGRYDVWLVKTDANGVAQWNQTYGGTENDKAFALIQTADGGFALAGGTRSYGASNWCMWLVKTDANGVTQWNQTYGGTGSDEASALILTTDGGFALAGGTESFGAGRYDVWLVKTDANGVAQWNQTYGGTGSDVASALIQTTDGGFALAGGTDSYGAGSYDIWLVKTDTHGVAQWNQTYGGTGFDIASDLIWTTDGGFALAGSTEPFGAGESNMWLVKTNANGVTQWNRTYGGTGSDVAYDLIQTTGGGFALAGNTESYGAGESDMWLVKTKPTSVLEELMVPFINLSIIGLIFFLVTLFLLIIVIKKQKIG